MIPATPTALILTLAAFRSYRLLARDDFPPLVAVRNRLVGARFVKGKPPIFARPLLADWLICAWCSGMWYAAGWYTAWLLWPHPALYAAMPLALSAAVGIAQAALHD